MKIGEIKQEQDLHFLNNAIIIINVLLAYRDERVNILIMSMKYYYITKLLIKVSLFIRGIDAYLHIIIMHKSPYNGMKKYYNGMKKKAFSSF